MSPIGSEAGLHAGCGFAIAVRDEVVGIAPGHGMVGLEVEVRHHMMVVALEQRDLQSANVFLCCATLQTWTTNVFLILLKAAALQDILEG